MMRSFVYMAGHLAGHLSSLVKGSGAAGLPLTGCTNLQPISCRELFSEDRGRHVERGHRRF